LKDHCGDHALRHLRISGINGTVSLALQGHCGRHTLSQLRISGIKEQFHWLCKTIAETILSVTSLSNTMAETMHALCHLRISGFKETVSLTTVCNTLAESMLFVVSPYNISGIKGTVSLTMHCPSGGHAISRIKGQC
jgi:hypothetical protein